MAGDQHKRNRINHFQWVWKVSWDSWRTSASREYKRAIKYHLGKPRNSIDLDLQERHPCLSFDDYFHVQSPRSPDFSFILRKQLYQKILSNYKLWPNWVKVWKCRIFWKVRTIRQGVIDKRLRYGHLQMLLPIKLQLLKKLLGIRSRILPRVQQCH